MKKLLVIGREGRLIKYAPEPDKLKEYDIVYAPVGAPDEELLSKGRDADFILVDAIGSLSDAWGKGRDHLCWKGDQPEEPCQTVFSAEQEQGGQDRPDGDAYHPV